MVKITGKLDGISRVKKPVFAPSSRQCQESFVTLASLVESYNRKKEQTTKNSILKSAKN